MSIKSINLDDYKTIEELIKLIDPRWDTLLSNKKNRIYFSKNNFLFPLDGLTEISLAYEKNVNYLNLRLKNSKINQSKDLLNNGYENGIYSWFYKKQINSLKELYEELKYVEKIFK